MCRNLFSTNLEHDRFLIRNCNWAFMQANFPLCSQPCSWLVFELALSALRLTYLILLHRPLPTHSSKRTLDVGKEQRSSLRMAIQDACLNPDSLDEQSYPTLTRGHILFSCLLLQLRLALIQSARRAVEQQFALQSPRDRGGQHRSLFRFSCSAKGSAQG